ncbi:hypothetical protein D3C80_1662920 [compost metagenome]
MLYSILRDRCYSFGHVSLLGAGCTEPIADLKFASLPIYTMESSAAYEFASIFINKMKSQILTL